MSYAFISYKTDDLEEALWVKDQLSARGIPCWMAPDSIPGGSSYAQEIPRAIRSCFAFILILSEATQESKFVPKEIDLAINLGKPILPFMIENFELRDDFNFYLSNVNRFPAYQSKERCINLIATRIDEILNGAKSGQSIDEIREQMRIAREQGHTPQYIPAKEIKQVEYIPPQSDYYPEADYQTPVHPAPQSNYPQQSYPQQNSYVNQGYYDNPAPSYNQPAYMNVTPEVSNKSFALCLLLCLFFGLWGWHRIYAGKIGTGILWMFSLGAFGLGWFSDVITILSGNFKDSNGKPVKPKSKR